MTQERKSCFGILDRVFPVGAEGLRQVPAACFECPDRTACLRAAMQTRDGLILRESILERSPAKGLAGRLRRWSDRKRLSTLKKQQERTKP